MSLETARYLIEKFHRENSIQRLANVMSRTSLGRLKNCITSSELIIYHQYVRIIQEEHHVDHRSIRIGDRLCNIAMTFRQ